MSRHCASLILLYERTSTSFDLETGLHALAQAIPCVPSTPGLKKRSETAGFLAEPPAPDPTFLREPPLIPSRVIMIIVCTPVPTMTKCWYLLPSSPNADVHELFEELGDNTRRPPLRTMFTSEQSGTPEWHEEYCAEPLNPSNNYKDIAGARTSAGALIVTRREPVTNTNSGFRERFSATPKLELAGPPYQDDKVIQERCSDTQACMFILHRPVCRSIV